MTEPTGTRQPTAVDAVADTHLRKHAALSPMDATAMGLAGYDHLIDPLDPAQREAFAALNRATLDDLAAVDPVDEIDHVTIAAMRERLGLELELHDAGEDLAELNNIASPVQGLRDIFDVMPTGSVEAWENISARLQGLPGAIDGFTESLRLAASRGDVAAIRQVRECVGQARELAGDGSFFTSFVTGEAARAALGDGQDALAADLGRAADGARAAYGKLADYLETELAPLAPEADAVGRDRYALLSRRFLGATIDLEETYAWGVEELARVTAEQEAVAREIAGPGATVQDAVRKLDEDPARKLAGTDALKAWMQETSDAAIRDLAGTHFDIPEPIRTLECMIAPTQNGGIYYTPPSDDFSRPGRMWWSVPPGVTEFNTWREKTTVYHEGVPGHHLQCAQAVHARDTLNSWRRLACWVSGHGEGWALYAERLMADLGYLDDPGDRLGMLDGQRMRAARVVFDIGVHLGLKAPAAWGGNTWDPDTAWEFLRANVNMPEEFIRFEYNRYLGWPGQAPSYKIGQRLWEEIRDEAKAAAEARAGQFDAKAFHANALNLGSVGLDVLREALTVYPDAAE
ncbi:DUF885 domain-containing protein [Myceligenerans crystallogenes]|uniref:DUF885 domain-containing protein n=1 Tax=Myceligenerans crystallogenes TaxID=316335 RepID=A0ABN2N5C3_9MICO